MQQFPRNGLSHDSHCLEHSFCSKITGCLPTGLVIVASSVISVVSSWSFSQSSISLISLKSTKNYSLLYMAPMRGLMSVVSLL